MTSAVLSTCGIWFGAVGLTLYGTYLTWVHSKKRPPHLDAPFALYPISVLKPLKGQDEGLRANLESFFDLDYPEYELIFSVADARDPSLPLVRKLIAAHPRIRARLIVGEVNVGVNPKVNNLIQSYDGASHDWILISDSNVRVERDYLKRMAGHIDNGVGVITSVVAGNAPEGLGGALEAVYLNTFYARGMHLSEAAGRPAVMGKSMLFRRSTAERFGGLKVLGKFLAEDFMAGEAMRRLGLRVVLASDPIPQIIGRASFKQFWQRHLRWGRIRKVQAPLAFAIEPGFGAIVSGLLGAYGMSTAFGISGAHFFLFHLLGWFVCDLLVLTRVTRGFSAWLPVSWIARELLAFPLWLAIASGNTVDWRGRRLVLDSGGLIRDPA